MSGLGDFADRFFGRGDAAVTVPPLDGALKPNNRIEDADQGFIANAPDNIIIAEDIVLYSSRQRVLQLSTSDGKSNELLEASDTITALAAVGGTLAVACGGKILFHSRQDDRVIAEVDLANVTAMAFQLDGTLVATVGTTENPLSAWQKDLLDGESAGSVWRIEPSTGRLDRLAQKLGFPNGVIVLENGDIVVSEAWKKRLIRLDAGGNYKDQVIEDLPGYPGRISASAAGGFWLSVFAPRSPLVEFVLREKTYRKAMMAQVDPEFWIAPALRSGYSFREPMQGGAIKQMGTLKPWAPTRSYGLVVELSREFVPTRSFHSRAGGKRHGTTSAVETTARLWITCKGGDEIVAVELATAAK